MPNYLLLGTTEAQLEKLKARNVEATFHSNMEHKESGIVVSNLLLNFALSLFNAKKIDEKYAVSLPATFVLTLQITDAYLVDQLTRPQLDALLANKVPFASEGSATRFEPAAYRKALQLLGGKEVSQDRIEGSNTVKVKLEIPEFYFLPHLAEPDLAVLSSTITLERVELDDMSGIRVDGANFVQLQAALQAQVEMLSPTSHAKTALAVVRRENEPKVNECVVETSFSDNESSWRDTVKRILMPALRMNVHVGHTRNEATIFRDEKFYINVGGAPVAATTVAPPQQMNGIPIRCRLKVPKLEAGENAVVVDGHVFALVQDGFNLYIGACMGCERFDSSTLKVLEYLLKRCLPLVLKFAEGRKSELKARREEQIQRSRKEYIVAGHQARKVTEARAEKAEQTSLKTLEQLQRSLAEAHATLLAARATKRGLLKKFEEFDEQKGREFDAISRLPKVRRFYIEDGNLNVITTLLYATDPRTNVTYEIGEFRFVIPLSGGNSDSLKWFNLTRKVSRGRLLDFQAPHVRENGTGCFLDKGEALNRHLRHYEYLAVVMLMFGQIEKLNVFGGEEWGPALIEEFPVRELEIVA